jgi:hypothetical protein
MEIENFDFLIEIIKKIGENRGNIRRKFRKIRKNIYIENFDFKSD